MPFGCCEKYQNPNVIVRTVKHGMGSVTLPSLPSSYFVNRRQRHRDWVRLCWHVTPAHTSQDQLQFKVQIQTQNSVLSLRRFPVGQMNEIVELQKQVGLAIPVRREWLSETKPWFRWWQLHWWQQRKASAIAIAPLSHSHSHLFQPVKDPLKQENRLLVWDISNRPLPDQYLHLESKTMLLESRPSFIKSRINLV